MNRPLEGVRVLELGGIGPAPHGAMMLADLGADVVRIARPGGDGLNLAAERPDWLLRNRRFTTVDLKDAEGLEFVKRLISVADVVIEAGRPGVVERLGIDPEQALQTNPGLIFARMTGWGQHGPRAHTAGHDINYLSLTGGLHALGHAGSRPTVPLNLLADIAGGSMTLVISVLAALAERGRTGKGQTLDVAMVDGTATALQMIFALRSAGAWSDDRASNLLDGGAPFYDTYECADGRWIAVGALEPAFYSAFVSGLGLDEGELPPREDHANWPRLREIFGEKIRAQSREHWSHQFSGSDACVTPVLTFAEAPLDPHLQAREAFLEIDGAVQSRPAPQFPEARATPPIAPPTPLQDDRAEIEADWLRDEAHEESP